MLEELFVFICWTLMRTPSSDLVRSARVASSADRSTTMEFYPTPGVASSSSFAGATLVIAVASHGNVGQLACDLLVQRLRARRVGSLDHPSLLPCVGGDAFGRARGDGGALAMSAEVYEVGGGGTSGPRRTILVQQRAEVRAGSQRAFASAVAAWASASAFHETVVLASAPSTAAGHGKGATAQIGATVVRHVLASAVAAAVDGAKEEEEGDEGRREGRFEDARFQAAGAVALERSTLTRDRRAASSLPPWSLLRAFHDDAAGKGNGKTSCVAVLALCSEGDNTADAVAVAAAAATALGLSRGDDAAEEGGKGEGEGWTAPASWAAAYGQRPTARAMFT